MNKHSLDVRDFGPIAEAGVEVRPLTVLIGPGNGQVLPGAASGALRVDRLIVPIC